MPLKKKKKKDKLYCSQQKTHSVKDYPISGLLHDKLLENCLSPPTFNHKFANEFTTQNYYNTTQNSINFSRISVTVILGFIVSPRCSSEG